MSLRYPSVAEVTEALWDKTVNRSLGGARAGVNAMTAALTAEFAPVPMNTIMPGAFGSDVGRHWTEEAVAAVCEVTALGRDDRPEKIGGTALYRATEASSVTTGTAISVDGGRA
ncbi:SDR family oxidoreductase [Nocardioides terrisoli]|uniref:SDR family oxidoreductase n=1 Tax=Nocardioides terrisoli TaxID=3388267 RepID=UPI00287B9EF1|nr:SDR family oxidoreductase [Nocardioides marmorisolisilvae]